MSDYQQQINQWSALPDPGWVAAHAPRFKAVQNNSRAGQGGVATEGYLTSWSKPAQSIVIPCLDQVSRF